MRIYVILSMLLIAFLGIEAKQLELTKPLNRNDEKVIRHEGYTCTFNTSRLTPTYVAWCLTRERTKGKVKRTNFFDVDPSIDKRFQVKHSDYSGSRYDRGHMCPSADNQYSQKAMVECFYMTNMCPQVAVLNQRWWGNLENACRRWVEKEGAVYICCGPIFDDAPAKTIGGRYNYSLRRNGIKVHVPTRFFKVVLSLKKGKEKAIGFIYNNDDSRQPMSDCCMSVDEVEKITGLDFFTSLEDTLENRLESTYDFSAWK